MPDRLRNRKEKMILQVALEARGKGTRKRHGESVPAGRSAGPAAANNELGALRRLAAPVRAHAEQAAAHGVRVRGPADAALLKCTTE